MIELGPVRKRFQGDPKVAASHIKVARVLLGELKARMRRLGISRLSRTVRLAGGVTVHVRSGYGPDEVRISKPENLEYTPVYVPYIFIKYYTGQEVRHVTFDTINLKSYTHTDTVNTRLPYTGRLFFGGIILEDLGPVTAVNLREDYTRGYNRYHSEGTSAIYQGGRELVPVGGVSGVKGGSLAMSTTGVMYLIVAKNTSIAYRKYRPSYANHGSFDPVTNEYGWQEVGYPAPFEAADELKGTTVQFDESGLQGKFQGTYGEFSDYPIMRPTSLITIDLSIDDSVSAENCMSINLTRATAYSTISSYENNVGETVIGETIYTDLGVETGPTATCYFNAGTLECNYSFFIDRFKNGQTGNTTRDWCRLYGNTPFRYAHTGGAWVDASVSSHFRGQAGEYNIHFDLIVEQYRKDYGNCAPPDTAPLYYEHLIYDSEHTAQYETYHFELSSGGVLAYNNVSATEYYRRTSILYSMPNYGLDKQYVWGELCATPWVDQVAAPEQVSNVNNLRYDKFAIADTDPEYGIVINLEVETMMGTSEELVRWQFKEIRTGEAADHPYGELTTSSLEWPGLDEYDFISHPTSLDFDIHCIDEPKYYPAKQGLATGLLRVYAADPATYFSVQTVPKRIGEISLVTMGWVPAEGDGTGLKSKVIDGPQIIQEYFAPMIASDPDFRFMGVSAFSSNKKIGVSD